MPALGTWFDARLGAIHCAMGMIGFLAFLLSGQYMHWALHHLAGVTDGPRLLYRSAHIYLLWSAMLNLLLGCYLRRPFHLLSRFLQILGSCAILLGPVFLSAAFLLEPSLPGLSRPYARAAIYLTFAGVIFHAAAAVRDKWLRR